MWSFPRLLGLLFTTKPVDHQREIRHGVFSFHSIPFSIFCCHTSRSTRSNTRQRPFDLWLCAASYATSLIGNITPSRPRFARERHNKVRPQHRELWALLFSNSAWILFYVPQNCEQWRVARRGLRFIVLIRQHWPFDQIVFNGYIGAN